MLALVSRLNTNKGDRVHQNESVSLSLVFGIRESSFNKMTRGGGASENFRHPKGGLGKIVGLEGGLRKFVYLETIT